MPSLRPRTLFLALVALAAGAGLRLWFIHNFPELSGDGLFYGDIAKNWLTHGIYGRSIQNGGVAPTLVRLPGYPAFLALCFALFGMENYRAVLYAQVAIDLCTCLLIAGFVERVCRKGMIALWLAVLCPFTANYVAMPLTETLSIFCVALGLYALAELLQQPGWRWLLALAVASSCAAMLRPDGVLLGFVLLPAVYFYGRDLPAASKIVRMAGLGVLLAALPFMAWAARNWHTFHVLQPLAPRYANDPGEFVPLGYQQWTKTWLIDFASTYEIYWNVPGDEFDLNALPARALQGPDAADTRALIKKYNDGYVLTPQLDGGFHTLAVRRIRAHPVRYYLAFPLLRLADMWLRPRVEMLNIELRWWQYGLHNTETEIAYAYGALNLLYLLAAVSGLFYWPRYATVMVSYVVLRSLLLATIEAPEPRYTLECFPIVIAFAAAAFGRFSVKVREQ